MSEPVERAFVVTQAELLALLGDGAAPFMEALRDSKARTKARPGSVEKIEVVVQGGKVVEVIGAPPRWKVLSKQP